MLDAYLRPLVTPVLDRAGRWLARRGFTADGVTVAGFVLGIAACIAIASEAYGLALILIALLLISPLMRKVPEQVRSAWRNY